MLVTFAVSNNGTVFNLKHWLNIVLMLVVTLDVFNSGTDSRTEQPLNMLDIFVTAPVLNNGIVFKALQTLNMLDVDVTDAVLNKGTDSSL
jgi:hypothetical protein